MTVRTACPVDESHGHVLDAPGERWAFLCPSQEHDGRPNTHPLGPAPAARAYFTTSEVEQGFLNAIPATRPSVDDLAVHGGTPSRDARRTPRSPVDAQPPERV